MSGCPKNYAGYNGTDDCNRNHSASLLYFISTIATMIVLGAATLLFFCCLYYKRRRIQERLRNARMRQAVPFTYYWPNNNNNNNNNNSVHEGGGPGAPVVTVQGGNQTTEMLPKATADRVAPLSCVIMAGEERPTFLAHPLPNDSYVDVNLDSKLDDLEKGKQAGDPKP